MTPRHRAIAWPDLRPYLHTGTLARAWAAGSLLLTRRIQTYIAAGEGPRGKASRFGATAACLGCAGEAVVMYPATAPCVILGAWTLAALAHSPDPAGAPDAPADTPPADPRPAADTPEPAPPEPTEQQLLLDLLDDLIGTDAGVHLQELYPAMRDRLPGLAEAPDEDLRQALADAGVRVDRTVRSRGIAGRSGVRRNALPSPGRAWPLSAPLSTHGDAGQSTPGEQPESERRAPAEPIPDSVTITPSDHSRYHRVTR